MAAKRVLSALEKGGEQPITVGEYAELVRRYPAALIHELDIRPDECTLMDLCNPHQSKLLRKHLGYQWMAWVQAYLTGRRRNWAVESMRNITEWAEDIGKSDFVLDDVAGLLERGISDSNEIATALAYGIDAELMAGLR